MKDWLRLTVLVIMSHTAEKKQLLSVKSFGFNCKWFSKLIMYIKNNKGLNIDPCGTLALVFLHDKNWPSGISLSNLALKI